jgi:hypothetical protein
MRMLEIEGRLANADPSGAADLTFCFPSSQPGGQRMSKPLH